MVRSARISSCQYHHHHQELAVVRVKQYHVTKHSAKTGALNKVLLSQAVMFQEFAVVSFKLNLALNRNVITGVIGKDLLLVVVILQIQDNATSKMFLNAPSQLYGIKLNEPKPFHFFYSYKIVGILVQNKYLNIITSFSCLCFLF